MLAGVDGAGIFSEEKIMADGNGMTSLDFTLGLLFVLFVALKLTGVIAWSWWWVTAPLWGGLAIVFAGISSLSIIAVLFGLVAAASKWFLDRGWRKK